MKRRWLEWGIGLALLGGLLLLYHWHGGATLWFLTLMTAIVLASGLILQSFGPRHIHVDRRMSRSIVPAGEEAQVTIRLQFRSVLPLPWLSIDDCYTGGSFRKVLFPGSGRFFEFSYSLGDLPRGNYAFEGFNLEWGGLLGWFRGGRFIKNNDQFTVLPTLLSASPMEPGKGADPGSPYTCGSLPLPSDTKGAEIRDYVAGDPLNRIYWKGSARRGLLQTFQPEKEYEREVLLFLDCSFEGYESFELPEENREEAADQAFETAISITASLLLSYRKAGYKVGLICDNWQFDAGPGKKAQSRVNGQGGWLLPEDQCEASWLQALASLRLLPESRFSPFAGRESGVKAGMRVAVMTGKIHHELAEVCSLMLSKGGQVDLYHSTFGALSPQAAILSGQGAGMFRTNGGHIVRIEHDEICFASGKEAAGHGG